MIGKYITQALWDKLLAYELEAEAQGNAELAKVYRHIRINSVVL